MIRKLKKPFYLPVVLAIGEAGGARCNNLLFIVKFIRGFKGAIGSKP